MQKTNRRQSGFTLIEVVLVLAIGSLIFLLAFSAFAQVQKNRRDAQRRQDARRVLALAEEFAVNNDGKVPCYEATRSGCYRVHGSSYDFPSWKEDFLPNYLAKGGLGEDGASGLNYWIYITYTHIYSGTSNSQDWFDNRPVGTVVYWTGAACDGSILDPTLSSSPTDIAVWVKLEKGAYCVSNA